jgi:hypothetical protein
MIRQLLASRGLALAAGALLAALLAPTLAHSDEHIAAAWEIGVKGSVFDNFGRSDGPVPYRGQTFAANSSGPLRAVALRIGRVGPLPPDMVMRIEIRATDTDGLPTSEPLAFVEVQADTLPNTVSQIVRFDFAPTTATLVANRSYAIIAYPRPFHPSGDPFFLNGDADAGATYPSGLALSSDDNLEWISYPAVDYGFEVLVGEGVATETSSWSRIKLLY